MPLGKRRFTTGNISITSGIEFYWEHNNFCGITAICMGDGAVEWIRTTTVLLPPAPQAGASASSATTALGESQIVAEASTSEEAPVAIAPEPARAATTMAQEPAAPESARAPAPARAQAPSAWPEPYRPSASAPR